MTARFQPLRQVIWGDDKPESRGDRLAGPDPLPWWWLASVWAAPRFAALFGALVLFRALGVIP